MGNGSHGTDIIASFSEVRDGRELTSKILELMKIREERVLKNIGNMVSFYVFSISRYLKYGQSYCTLKMRKKGKKEYKIPDELFNLIYDIKNIEAAAVDRPLYGKIIEAYPDQKHCRIQFPDGSSGNFKIADLHIVSDKNTGSSDNKETISPSGFDKQKVGRIIKSITASIYRSDPSTEELGEIQSWFSRFKLTKRRPNSKCDSGSPT